MKTRGIHFNFTEIALENTGPGGHFAKLQEYGKPAVFCSKKCAKKANKFCELE